MQRLSQASINTTLILNKTKTKYVIFMSDKYPDVFRLGYGIIDAINSEEYSTIRKATSDDLDEFIKMIYKQNNEAEQDRKRRNKDHKSMLRIGQ